MKPADFESLDRMIGFIRDDLRHCIGADANWVVALALSAYTEAFGHMLPNMQTRGVKNFECYNEFLTKWMNYGQLIDSKHPAALYNEVRNGLVHEYLLKVDAEVNMGTGSCGIEIRKKGRSKFVRFNIITYYNDFMEAVIAYSRSIRTDRDLQQAFVACMNGRQRLR